MLKTWRNTKNVCLFDYVFISPIFPFILEEDSKFKKGAQALGNPHWPLLASHRPKRGCKSRISAQVRVLLDLLVTQADRIRDLPKKGSVHKG